MPPLLSLRTTSFLPRLFSRNYSSHHASSSTIFALSTPPGTSAIALLRISGPLSLPIYHSLTRSSTPPKPRHAHVRPLHHPLTGAPIDPGALVLFFSRETSLTGEDLVELHVHGSRAIVRSLLLAIPECERIERDEDQVLAIRKSIRPAEPGEFTQRAFYANRLTLPQVENLAGLLHSNTAQQLAIANRGHGSSITNRFEGWRQELVEARGVLEALIDFADDQGFEESSGELVKQTAVVVDGLRSKVGVYTTNAVRGELLRSGISLALVGAPNAGKSSLLNRVVGREAAIVSEEAGTTRDVVDLSVDIGGYVVLLGDTAGLRKGEEAGKVEVEGMRRTLLRVEASDVVVAVVDVRAGRIAPEVLAALETARNLGRRVVAVANKTDLIPGGDVPIHLAHLRSQLPDTSIPILPISCAGGGSGSGDDGIQSFLKKLEGVFADLTSPTNPNPSLILSRDELEDTLATTTRQKVLLDECNTYLDSFLQMVAPMVEGGEGEGEGEVDVVLAAECLRMAADCVGKVTGRGESGDVEEVLGIVFEKFCVGK